MSVALGSVPPLFFLRAAAVRANARYDKSFLEKIFG
ncbi:hypothetical protein BH09MYX1_BH09MYX1_03830 [soil metagenome]